MRKGVIEYGAEKNWVIASLVWGVCVFTLFPACGGGDNQGSQDAFIPRDAFRPDAPDSFVVADGGAMDSPGPSPSDAGSDAAMPMDAGSDGGPFMPSNDCMGYCRLVTMNCSGDNSQYIDMSDCMAKCAALGWPPGTPGENTGNTIACRITHAMMASGGSAEEACRRAGPTGGGVCGAPIAFDMRPSEMATRVDRMGMPAVATASIPRGRRNEYNDANPADDLMLRFANDQAMAIAQLHMLLDDDLMAMGLMPCSMTMTEMLPIGPGGAMVPVPRCFAQRTIDGGPRVIELVVPDTLRVISTQPSRFPNGRQPNDPVMDVVLAAVLLDLTRHSPATFAMMPLNPPSNASGEISDRFPYLGVPARP